MKLLTTNAECSDTSVKVTFPCASMSDGSMFKDYVVEARDTNSGVIKATATVNTEYRIDADIALRYKGSYSVDVNGLLEDTTYDFYIYGRNFYGKCSTKPLVVTAKTTGTRTGNGDEKGDVNGDFYTDVRDLVALKKNGETAINKDVDENGTEDAETDKKGLIRILLGYTSVVQDSEKDLLGQSTYQSGTRVAGKKGYGIQTKVVNNTAENFTDSKAAYEVWATAEGIGTGWGLGTKIYFDKAQDWSGKNNTLNFDVLSKDGCATRSYEICLISGKQELLSSKLWMESAATSNWTTVSFVRNSFTNVDWTNVKGIRIYMQFDNSDGRYDGVEKSSFFVDNMYTSYTVMPDKNSSDLLEAGTVSYGGYSTAADRATAEGYCMKDDRVVLKFTRKAMESCGNGYPYFTVTLPEGVSVTDDDYISMDGWFSTYAHNWFMIDYLDKDGNKIATAQGRNYSGAKETWDNVAIQASTITMNEGKSLSDIRAFRITSNVEKNVSYDIEYYFDNLRLLKTRYTFDGMHYAPTNEIDQGCTLQPVLGPLYGKEGEVFTKFRGGDWSGSPRINIKDSEFKSGLTTADSVSFWVYAPTQTGNVASLKLKLCDIYHSVYKDYVEIPFDTWTKVTLTGEEMKTYISGSGLMIWTATTSKTDGGGRYLEMYMSDIEVTKGIYAAVDTTGSGNICEVQSAAGPLYEKAGELFYKFKGDSWSGTPRICINDTDFKSSLTAADSVSFWAYIPTPVDSNIEALSFGLYNEYPHSTTIKNQMNIPFDTWTEITISGAEMEKYLSADELIIWFRTTKVEGTSGGLYPVAYFSDIEITKGTN